MRKPKSSKAAGGRTEGGDGVRAECGSGARSGRRSAARAPSAWLWYAGGTLVFLWAVIQAYAPALSGEFLFDDSYLPFADPSFADRSVRAWTGIRPLLMITFWINYRFFGNELFWLHLFNVLLHFLNGVLVFLIARRLLAKAGEQSRLDLLSAVAAGVFLLHPIQTESVAYITSRSEVLSVLFFYGALAVFLYRREEAISLREAAAVLALFGSAVLTKEHTAVLPVLLVLTDLFFGGGPALATLRRNWRLYLPVLLAGAAGAAFVWRVLSASDSAGFQLRDLTWYQYFFTQCRVIWMYVRLVLLPFGQNVDPDVPVSRTIIEHGAIAGLLALLALAVAAVLLRRRYPLACYGVLAAFVLLAPTSSVVPIQDVAAERRVYLPLLGFLLAGLEFLRWVRLSRTRLIAGAGVVLILLAGLTWRRSRVWSNAIALWSDSAAKSPRKVRPRFQLAYAYYAAGRCAEAVREYAAAARLQPPDFRLLLDWALACDCNNQPEEALARLREAIAIERHSHAFALAGMVEGKRGNRGQAMQALATALELDSRNDAAWAYRGNLFATAGELEQAAADYRQALSINPRNQIAQRGLAAVDAERLRRKR